MLSDKMGEVIIGYKREGNLLSSDFGENNKAYMRGRWSERTPRKITSEKERSTHLYLVPTFHPPVVIEGAKKKAFLDDLSSLGEIMDRVLEDILAPPDSPAEEQPQPSGIENIPCITDRIVTDSLKSHLFLHQVNPQNNQTIKWLANYYMGKQDYSAAREYYDKILALERTPFNLNQRLKCSLEEIASGQKPGETVLERDIWLVKELYKISGQGAVEAISRNHQKPDKTEFNPYHLTLVADIFYQSEKYREEALKIYKAILSDEADASKKISILYLSLLTQKPIFLENPGIEHHLKRRIWLRAKELNEDDPFGGDIVHLRQAVLVGYKS